MAKTGAIRAGRAYVEIFADNSKLISGMRAAEKRVLAFGQSIRSMGLYMAAAGAAIVAPMLKASQVFARMGDTIAKMSKRTGLSVETLSAFNFIVSQSGSTIEAFEKGIRKMQQGLYDLRQGLSTTVDAFTDLGLTTKDFEGLNPEQQFMLIAGQLAKVKDASLQAALAQRVFGRAGTALLPMIKLGAEGIGKLRDKAEQMGLIMSKEDTVAAERWNDVMDLLSRTIKMGVFRVGQALAPLLEKIANSITEVSARFSKFINENRGIIVSVFKIGVGILAAGAAFITFGTVMIGVSKILGLFRIALLALKAIYLITFSPLGIAIGLIALFIQATIGWSAAISKLGEKFSGLKNDMSKAIGGISAALKSGNVGLAAKIFWLTIKLEWQKATLSLTTIWENIYAKISSFWTNGSFGDSIQYALNVAWAHIKKWGQQVWELIKGLATLGMQGIIKKAATEDAVSTLASKMMEQETGEKLPIGAGGGGIMTASKLDSETEYNKRLAPYLERARKKIEEIATNENIENMFPGGHRSFQDILDRAASVKEDSVPVPKTVQDARTAAEKAAAAKIASSEKDLAKAQAEYDAAIAEAQETNGTKPASVSGYITPRDAIIKSMRRAREITGDVDTFSIKRDMTSGQLMDMYKKSKEVIENFFKNPKIPEMNLEGLAGMSGGNSKSFGTFSAFALDQLGGQSPVLAALEKIARGIEKVVNNTEDNGED